MVKKTRENLVPDGKHPVIETIVRVTVKTSMASVTEKMDFRTALNAGKVKLVASVLQRSRYKRHLTQF